MATWALGSSNQEKIRLYDDASEADILAWQNSSGDVAHAWSRNPDATYAEALALLDQIPPMRPGTLFPCLRPPFTIVGLGNGTSYTKIVSEKEKTLPALHKVALEAGWMDAIVAQHRPSFDAVVPHAYKYSIGHDMAADHRQPAPAELTESATDEFHISKILRPAVNVAGAMLDEKLLTVGFPRMENRTKGDLSVYTPFTKEDKERVLWVSIEDKRLEVFRAHHTEFRSYGDYDLFPWPTNADDFEKATAGKRMWIQLWGQMHEYKVHYGKIFSIFGVIYVRRSETNPNELIFSKIYTSLDGEVTHSLCMILEARKRAQAAFARAQTIPGRLHLFSRLLRDFVFGWIIKWKLLASLFWGYWTDSCAIYVLFNNRAIFFRDISREANITRRFLPTLFTKFVGAGASGVVWRSLAGSNVVKVFNNRELALHEANVLEHARNLPVPTLQGIVDGGRETGVVMSYEGIPIGDLDRATPEQKHQLLGALESLHARGIHHHDIRGSNVLVGPQGAVTIIDFDHAELDSKCVACSDIVIRRELEADSVLGFEL
ncbi:hypothetical protein C8R44DRAFT_826498 [Mycena epipterygia]|nr:hypothetical protein C8R44DRAFT_826498 [Mycena epipterygia]